MRDNARERERERERRGREGERKRIFSVTGVERLFLSIFTRPSFVDRKCVRNNETSINSVARKTRTLDSIRIKWPYSANPRVSFRFVSSLSIFRGRSRLNYRPTLYDCWHYCARSVNGIPRSGLISTNLLISFRLLANFRASFNELEKFDNFITKIWDWKFSAAIFVITQWISCLQSVKTKL